MDSTALFLGILFGSIGLGYFIYGKRQSHLIARYTGIALMVYPYMIENNVALVAVGILLMLIPKFIKN